jgi:hypothetical protein
VLNIELDIDGVPDRAITLAIARRVRKLGRQINRPEDWRVRLAQSEVRDEWDLGIHSASGWRLASFTTPLELLPETVERTLRERLVLPMPDASPLDRARCAAQPRSGASWSQSSSWIGWARGS